MPDEAKLKRGIDFIGTGVVFFCHDGAGNFVMMKRGKTAKDEHGRWDIGGGGVKHGESLEEAVRREVLEEYGAEIETLQPIGFREVRRVNGGTPTHWIAFDFLCKVDRSKVRMCEPDKFTDLQWFSMKTLPPESEIHSQLPTFFKKYSGSL